MNRRERRAAAARRRRHDRWYQEYIQHLPKVDVSAPLERGQIYHVCFHHDPQCSFYERERIEDCNCDPTITRHVEPLRS
jgi:hypothetical protein